MGCCWLFEFECVDVEAAAAAATPEIVVIDDGVVVDAREARRR